MAISIRSAVAKLHGLLEEGLKCMKTVLLQCSQHFHRLCHVQPGMKSGILRNAMRDAQQPPPLRLPSRVQNNILEKPHWSCLSYLDMPKRHDKCPAREILQPCHMSCRLSPIHHQTLGCSPNSEFWLCKQAIGQPAVCPVNHATVSQHNPLSQFNAPPTLLYEG